MRPRKPLRIFCAIALFGLIGLWIGSYLVLRSKYGEVSRSGAYESRNTKVRHIFLDYTDDAVGSATTFADTVYAPLRVIDEWTTDIEVTFIVQGSPPSRTTK